MRKSKNYRLNIILLFVFLFSINIVQAWETATPDQAGMNINKLIQARDYALTGGGSGCIIRGGKLILSWGDLDTLYDLKSSTKSIGLTALGLALDDGLMSLNERAQTCLQEIGIPPEENGQTGWLEKITIRHLATQTAGFDKPGGWSRLLFAPGSKWAYSDCGPNWLADCMTVAFKEDLKTVLFRRVFSKLGISENDLTWRNNAYREDTIYGFKRRELGSGIKANIKALSLIGYLYLREGTWQGRQLLPKEFVRMVRQTPADVNGLPVTNDPTIQFENASGHYGLLWWNNNDGTLKGVPKDAYWSWGLYDSFIFIIPSLDLVITRAGKSIPGDRSPSNYKIIEPFLRPVAESAADGAPYPQSKYITSLVWDSTIVRDAQGSDLWVSTWTDDDQIYTVYGDGWGFLPRVPDKLSQGFTKISGTPQNYKAVNIRSGTGETTGDGKKGKKASGLLMANGTLYMWVRNANQNGEQSQLAWSRDHAKTWTWSDWTFPEFGTMCFVNFGKNYSDVPEEFAGFVYILSSDGPGAYNEADRVILLRVQQNRITDKSAYRYYSGTDEQGIPVWSENITDRQPVFSFPGGCNRMDVTYHPGLQRFLMTMRGRGIAGGVNHFSIYEAPQLWDPWKTVYYTQNWQGKTMTELPGNGGWGESAHIPAKWINGDDNSFYLIFAGDDCFSLRKAYLTVAARPHD
ncbi:serine hydrolase [candidate division KSB1 bacterium]|nr:serine hydrolase [candidate division KSB1 bacterium]